MPMTSTVNGVRAYMLDGLIYLTNSTYDRLVTKGSSVQIVSTNGVLWLWWIDQFGALQKALINSDMTIGSSIQIEQNVLGFCVKYFQSIGDCALTIIGTALNIQIGAVVYTSSWPVERLHDFDFDMSDDLQKVYVFYKKPGSPIQAFVEEYQVIIAPTLVQTFSVYDFSLGARDLPSELVPLFV